MGSMKQKKRKARAKEWAQFQAEQKLSDETIQLARATGYPLKLLREKLANSTFDEGSSVAERIQEIHRRLEEKRAKRKAAVEAGLLAPHQRKKKTKAERHDPLWAKAKKVCRLNMEDIRMAKELGLNPRTLMKNVPSRAQGWKAPVKVWIRDMYEERQERLHRKSHGLEQSTAVSKQPGQVDHERIVRDWEKNANRNDDENYQFLRSMKFRDYGFDPDELVGELHEQAFHIVDCTRCANCCKTTQPKFEEDDVARIAGHMNMSEHEFIDTYLDVDKEDPPYRTRQMPCAFLGEDNRCTIYDVRPTVCREYPHTNKEGLVFRTIGVANNTLVCPAVFWIVEQMKQYAR